MWEPEDQDLHLAFPLSDHAAFGRSTDPSEVLTTTETSPLVCRNQMPAPLLRCCKSNELMLIAGPESCPGGHIVSFQYIYVLTLSKKCHLRPFQPSPPSHPLPKYILCGRVNMSPLKYHNLQNLWMLWQNRLATLKKLKILRWGQLFWIIRVAPV